MLPSGRGNGIGERGAAYVVVLLVVCMLSMVGGVLLMISMADYRAVRSDVRRVQALYAAEAGVERGLQRLLMDPGYAGELSGTLDEDVRYVVAVEQDGERAVLMATGWCGDRTVRVRVVARVVEGELPRYVLMAAGKLEIIGDAVIAGDVYGDEVEIIGLLRVQGAFEYSGRLEGDVVADVVVEVAPVVMPVVDMERVMDAATDYYDQPQVFVGGHFHDQVIVVDADLLRVRGMMSGRVTFVCTGVIEIGGDLEQSAGSVMWLIAGEKIESRRAEVVDAVAIAPRIEVRLNDGEVAWTGALWGEDVQVECDLSLVLDAEMAGGHVVGGGGRTVIIDSWDEVL